MRKKKKNNDVVILALIILGAIILFGKGIGRAGLTDYAQEQGLTYDSFTSNTLTTTTTTKSFYITPITIAPWCGGTGTEYNRTIQNNKWTSTAITRNEQHVSQFCECSVEVGSYLPTISIGGGSMLITTKDKKTPQAYSCSESMYVNPTPVYTKFDWAGKDAVIKLYAESPRCDSSAHTMYNTYGSLYVGNVPIPVNNSNNLLEIKWSKVNPRTFAVFSNGDLMQESTIPRTETITVCPDYVCGQYTAAKTGCDPSLKNTIDYSIVKSDFSYDIPAAGTFSIGSGSNTRTLFQAATGKGIFVKGVPVDATSYYFHYSSSTHRCYPVTVTITYHYVDGTTATATDTTYCFNQATYCNLDMDDRGFSRTLGLGNPYPDKLVNKITAVDGRGDLRSPACSAEINGGNSVTYGGISLSAQDAGTLTNLQQTTCTGSYGTIYKNRYCDPTASLNPLPEDACQSRVDNVTTRIGFLPAPHCDVNEANGQTTYPATTFKLMYLRYALPFNCDMEPGDVKVYQVFEPGTNLVLESTKYPVKKFCREFKAEIYQSGAGMTVDAADEIYETLALGENLTIPGNQHWALHYITQTKSTCNTSQEIDVTSGKCVPAEGFAQKIAFLSGQIEQQALLIQQLNATMQEKAAIIKSLNLTLQNQITLIASLNMTVKQQATLIRDLNMSTVEQANLINHLQTNLNEKAALILQLNASNERQAALIAAMNLEFSQQGAIIKAMNLTIKEDAVIISNLTRENDKQAIIINSMDLNTLQQAELIAELQLQIDDEAKLISDLKLKVEEQLLIIEELYKLGNLSDSDLARLISELAASKAQVNDLLNKLGKSEQEKVALQAQIDELKGRTSDHLAWLEEQWNSTEGKVIIIGIAVLLFYVLFEAGPGKGFFRRN